MNLRAAPLTVARTPRPAALSVERARTLLAKCRTLDEAKSIRDKAEAVRVYLRSVKAAEGAQQDAAEIAVRATRRMGELLAVMPKATGDRLDGRDSFGGCKVKPPKNEAPTLSDLGIEKTDAHRAQRLAEVPEEKIDAYVAECREKQRPVTKAGALALTKEPKPAEPEFHILLALGDFKDAIRRLVQRWPEAERGALPEALRDLAAEFEEAWV